MAYPLHDHFRKKFPQHSAAIKELALRSAVFGTILADYEEIATWLAANESRAHQNPDELERARGLARELEAEILSCIDE